MKPSAVFLKSITRLEDLPDDGRPQIAVVGRSNVGKSSLINHLTGQRIARTSSSPGLTQTINFFDVNGRYYLVDLPGYGYARKSLERREFFSRMITDYLQRTEALKLVLLVIDARIGPTDLDEAMLEFLEKAGLPFLLIANKADKLAKSVCARLARTLAADHPQVKCLLYSTMEKANRGAVIAAIESVLTRRSAS